ncbi:hypothetical protein EHP00_1344 [Ecytonucleospora hepatopenaei]|uniref:Uncharacterized protein n=1 Tax=Ecytonucleospora hepatopenaei TaxID=646526 RepID=A0A1W0E738_9MICR|nr:hypothetical protein EHP00_1344 [Ecytonucleospora hepatopenaei]
MPTTHELPQHICDQINEPSCGPLRLDTTTYLSKSGTIFGVQINAPYTFLLLIIGILQCLRMYQNTSSMHACIGKGEVKIILLLFVIFNFLTIPVINFQFFLLMKTELFYTVLSAFQMTAFATFFFAIFASGITIDRIHGIMRMSSHSFLAAATFCFSFIILGFCLIGLFIYNYYLFVIILSINTFNIIFYVLNQIKKLKRIKSDVWAYGILGILFTLYMMSILMTVVGADIIALVTEKNLDNFFFFTIFNTLMVIMYHKYWLSTCDFEIECLEFKFQ